MKLRRSPRRTSRPAKKGGLPPLRKLVRNMLNHRHAWRVIAISVAVIAALVIAYHFVDADAVKDYAEQINPFAVFSLLTVLPLVGFPVNVLHIAAGVRFGFALGMVLVAASILLQLLASYALVHMFPQLFARRLAKIRARIPAAAHGTVCVFTLLIPGIPYFLQNYTLALIGVPLRTYLSRCLPLHTLRAVLTVGLGQQSGHFTPLGVTLLTLYWVVVLAASWWTYQRLQAQLADQPSAAGGRRQPA